MFVHQLQTVIYPDGSDWQATIMKHPTSKEIESAVRNLDRIRHPFIFLFQDADAVADAIPDFTVMGGQGAFAFGTQDLFFYDESQPGEEIQLWMSDQGASFPKWHVCNNVDVVVSATRIFAETGMCDSTLTWKQLLHK
jgi:hypothetical protein